MPGRGLVIDVPQIEGGTFVLGDVADRIDVTEVDSWNQIDDIYWFLAKGKHDYRWVAIDSITAFQALAMRRVVKERDLDIDPHKVTMPEWGTVGSLVSEMVYRFRTLPISTIWIAQERNFKDDDSARGSMVGPDVSPMVLGKLMPSQLLVGRLFVDQQIDGTWQRHMRIGPSSEYHTKYRARPDLNVPSVIREPNLGQLLLYLIKDGPRPDEVNEGGVLFATT